MGKSVARTPVSAEPEKAVTALVVEDGWIIGLATENEPGYSRLNYGPFEDEEDARKLADHINANAYSLTYERANMIVLSSMFPAPPAAHAKRRASWPK